MKKVITLILLLSSLLVKSQSMVGYSRKEIESFGQKEMWKMTTSTTKNGVPFIEVDDKNGYRFYYFNNDTCNMYLVFLNTINGEEIERSLNESYTKQDTTWYSNNAIINLTYDEILKGYFVKYKLIKD